MIFELFLVSSIEQEKFNKCMLAYIIDSILELLIAMHSLLLHTLMAQWHYNCRTDSNTSFPQPAMAVKIRGLRSLAGLRA